MFPWGTLAEFGSFLSLQLQQQSSNRCYIPLFNSSTNSFRDHPFSTYANFPKYQHLVPPDTLIFVCASLQEVRSNCFSENLAYVPNE